MKKRIIFILFVVLLIIPVCLKKKIIYGLETYEISQETLEVCKDRAELFLDNIHQDKEISGYVVLKNLNKDNEAILFKTGELGYIIVNINDLSVPELSLEEKNPYDGYSDAFYNGPLQYYYSFNDEIISIKDGKNINLEELDEYYTKDEINDLDEYLEDLLQSKKLRYVITEKYLSGTLQKWYIDGNNCGSIAAAICMRYFYDYIDTSYVASNKIDQDSLIALMQEYVGSGFTNYYNVSNGLNNYFKTNLINNSTSMNAPFSFSKFKQSIISNRPIIVGTINHPTYGNHWIIGHGYFESRVDGNYLIINDGWRKNNVWIEPSTTTLDGTISFVN